MRALIFVAGMLVATVASAQSERTQRTPLTYYLGTASTHIHGNANEATRTFSVSLDSGTMVDPARPYQELTLFFNLVRTTADAVGLACYASNDGGTTLYQLQYCTTSAGVCTLNDASWTKAVTGNKTWAIRIDTTGLPKTMKCIASFTTGGANDELTVSGILSTK